MIKTCQNGRALIGEADTNKMLPAKVLVTLSFLIFRSKTPPAQISALLIAVSELCWNNVAGGNHLSDCVWMIGYGCRKNISCVIANGFSTVGEQYFQN